MLTEQNVKMMQNVIRMLDMEGVSLDNNSPIYAAGTIRALSLVFTQVSPPPDLQPKLAALLNKANVITLSGMENGVYESSHLPFMLRVLHL